MPFPPIDKSFEGLFKDTLVRLTLVERRLAISGGGGGGGGDAVFAAGLVSSWSGPPSTVPSGWLLCDGRAISRTQFPALYAAIGTTYGVGDGTTTFNIPDGKGRVVVGQDGAQVEFDVVGETGGAKTHTLTNAQLPALVDLGGFQVGVANQALSAGGVGVYQRAASSAIGGGQAHNNLQPYIVQNWIISTGAGSTPPSGAVVPVQLWQEFTIQNPPSGVHTPVGGKVVWDGATAGTLGATLSADKTTITVPSAGTYRIVTHLGAAGAVGAGVSGNAEWGGAGVGKSLYFGNAGAAGVYVAYVEFYVTATGPTTLKQAVTAGNGMYDWSWLRIEKLEPFFPNQALTVNQGSTGQRDAIYGAPANATEQASLANRMIAWFNTDKGWYETYYAVTGTAGLTAPALRTGFPSGWYPNAGTPIYCTVRRSSAQSMSTTITTIVFDQVLSSHTFAGLPGAITIPIGGDYEISASAVASQTGGNYFNLYWYNNGTNQWSETGSVFPHTNAYSRSFLDAAIVPLKASDVVTARGQTSSAGQIEANSARFTVKYIGPPFA